MKLGKPNDFGNARSIRIRAIESAIVQYKFNAQELKNRLTNRLDEHTVLFLKGLGSEINLLSAFRKVRNEIKNDPSNTGFLYSLTSWDSKPKISLIIPILWL